MADEDRSTDPGRKVRHQQLSWGDIYEGDQAALIEAGVAKADWFPVEPQFDKWGRTRRTFKVESEGRSVSLCQRGTGDYWGIRVYLRDGERRERDAGSVAQDEPAPPAPVAATRRESLEALKRKIEATGAACILAADGLARLIAGTSQDSARCLALVESNLFAALAIARGGLEEARKYRS